MADSLNSHVITDNPGSEKITLIMLAAKGF
jgi:hypothetical protein